MMVQAAQIDPNNPVHLQAHKLALNLVKHFNDPNYQPPRLPQVAMQLMELSRKPDAEIHDIAHLLEQDVVLAGQFLKIASSALYSGNTPVRSMERAVARMGLRAVRDVVMMASMDLRVFRVTEYADLMESLRKHSQAVAHSSRVIASCATVDMEFAFMAGLLHDVGIAGTLLALVESSRPDPPPGLDLTWPVIKLLHEQASDWMARRWQLPEEVIDVVGSHHNYEEGISDLNAVVALADLLVEDVGLGMPEFDDDFDRQEAISHLRNTLRLSQDAMDYISDEIARALSGINASNTTH